MRAKPRACFYVPLKDPELLRIVEFYRNDARILEDLGFEVAKVTRPSQLRFGFDLYFYHWWGRGSAVLPFAWGSRAPVISTGTMDDVPSMPTGYSNLPAWKRAVVKCGIQHSTAQLAVSELELEALIRHKARRPRLVPNAIDTRLYSPAPAVPKSEFPLICTVSHLNSHNIARKGVLRLVETAALLRRDFPNLRVIIAGTPGEGYERLTSRIDELGLGAIVSLPGRVSVQEKIDLYRSSWLYSQLSDHEGFGVAAAEAMSCGTPVAGCRAGALHEVIGDTGLVIEENKPAACADAIAGLLRDAERRTSAGAKARSRIETLYSYDRRRESIGGILQEIGAI